MMSELTDLWEALGDSIDPATVEIWFHTPNDSFDGLKPIEVYARGDIKRLWNVVFVLNTGMPG
jgi:hypothetical protein